MNIKTTVEFKISETVSETPEALMANPAIDVSVTACPVETDLSPLTVSILHDESKITITYTETIGIKDCTKRKKQLKMIAKVKEHAVSQALDKFEDLMETIYKLTKAKVKSIKKSIYDEYESALRGITL